VKGVAKVGPGRGRAVFHDGAHGLVVATSHRTLTASESSAAVERIGRQSRPEDHPIGSGSPEATPSERGWRRSGPHHDRQPRNAGECGPNAESCAMKSRREDCIGNRESGIGNRFSIPTYASATGFAIRKLTAQSRVDHSRVPIPDSRVVRLPPSRNSGPPASTCTGRDRRSR
jgi:hypothetical protein